MKNTFLIICLLASTNALGQNIEERVYMQVNTTTLISGESLLFSAFVNSKLTQKPSNLSKILYAELINAEGQVAHRSKVSISKGRGYGEIFISSNMPTGSYQLVAYTRWMKNFDSFSQTVVNIINPFTTSESLMTQSSNPRSMEFHLSGNNLISGVENRLVYHLIGYEPDEVKASKLVGPDGVQILDFDHGNSNYGVIYFIPPNPGQYQIILEDKVGNFDFYNLPAVEPTGVALAFKSFDNSFEFRLLDPNRSFEGRIVITSPIDTIRNEMVVNNSAMVLPKKTLKKSLHLATLIDNDEKVINRIPFMANLPQINVSPTLGKYNTRSKVVINPKLTNGSYSISVRKKDLPGLPDLRKRSQTDQLYQYFYNYAELMLASSQDPTADINTILATGKLRKTQTSLQEVNLLPEHRGELISGKVVDEKGEPLPDRRVGYATLGSNQLAFTKTDEKGEFLINVYSLNKDTDSFLLLLDEEEPYTIDITEKYLESPPPIFTPELNLDSLTVQEIVQSSINLQIENAYYEHKKDSSLGAVKPYVSFEDWDFYYVLDDYNRFPTIKETFYEYMPAVAVRKRKGKTVLHIRSGEYNPTFDEDPLILLDGLPVDTESLLGFSPFKVYSVGVISKRVYYGSQIFDGVISLHTVESNLHDFQVSENTLRFTMKGLESKKQFNYPDYSSQRLQRIPGRREQLYWNPEVTSEGESSSFQFYTSDVTGTFEIAIDGFTYEGEPVSIRQEFVVE